MQAHPQAQFVGQRYDFAQEANQIFTKPFIAQPVKCADQFTDTVTGVGAFCAGQPEMILDSSASISPASSDACLSLALANISGA